MHRPIKKLFDKILTMVVVASLLFTFGANIQPTNAGHTQSKLIDDGLFIDSGSMNSGQIAGWLDGNAGFLKNWVDNVHHNYPNKYQEGNTSRPCRVHIATDKSAAQIIAEAAVNWQAQYVVWRDSSNSVIPPSQWASTPSSQIKSCRTETANWPAYGLNTVSPKVILATLQKEQSLITATGTYSTSSIPYNDPACCSSNEYKLAWAMGYGVPDSGGKNHRFKGFYNQVNWAAWQFRFNYERSAAKATSNCGLKTEDASQSGLCWDDAESITYGGPMTKGTFTRCSSCSPQSFSGYTTIDGQSVFISNRATASLYYYTPHLGQSFPGIYSGWFGSTHVATYKARLYGKSNMFGIKPGLSKEVFIAYRNIGSATWYDIKDRPEGVSPTVLASSDPLYRLSKFNGMFERTDKPNVIFSSVLKSDGSPECAQCQYRVLPNQIVKFTFTLVAPMDIVGSRIYEEYFEIIKQPFTRMGGQTSIKLKIPSLDLDAASAGTSGLRGARPGWALSTFVKLKNTGNVVWYDKTSALDGVQPLVLSTAKPTGRSSIFSDVYEFPNRPISVMEKVFAADGVTLASNQNTVRPGETAVFRFVMTIPNRSPGIYTEWLGLRFAGAPSLIAGNDIPIKIKILESN